MTTFVLIIVLAGYTHGSPGNVVAEFNTFAACEKARKHIVNSIEARAFKPTIVSQGCYPK